MPVVSAERLWCPEGRLRLIFLGRLHPKKGLDSLLEAMTRLPASVSLDIYGSGEDGYEQQLQTMIEELALVGRVTLRGHVDAEAKTRAFEHADLFVLPTHSENFGIAIAEALAHGVPVITTKAAPWAGLLEHECGDWIDLSVEDLVTSIQTMSKRDLCLLGANGRRWIVKDYANQTISTRHAQLYRSLLASERQTT